MAVVDIIMRFFHESSYWELSAVFLSLTYVVLAIKQNPWCWPAALISTAIYTWLFWHVSLVMDSALQVYYMAMAVYGWWCWQGNASKKEAANQQIKQKKETQLHVHTWPWHWHVFAIAGVLLMSLISSYLLREIKIDGANIGAAWPLLDSMTTWGAVLATYMVAKKVLENWLYFIAIDLVSIGLYIERGLQPTAMLFAIYTVMAVVGYLSWRKELFARRALVKNDVLEVS